MKIITTTKLTHEEAQIINKENALKYKIGQTLTKEDALKFVQELPMNFNYLSKELQDDIDIATLALIKNSDLIKIAGNNVRNNKEIMLKVVGNNGYLLKYASKELKNDKDIILEAIKNNAEALSLITNQMVYYDDKFDCYNDEDIAKVMVEKNEFFIQYASEKIKNNKEVALISVKAYGVSLEHFSTKIKKNREVVCEAFKTNKISLKNIQPSLRKEIKNSGANTTEKIIEYLENKILFDKLDKKAKQKHIIKLKKKI